MARVIRLTNKETGEKESLESMLKRFKKQVLAEDIIADYKKHEFFRSKSIKRKEKILANQRRALKNK